MDLKPIGFVQEDFHSEVLDFLFEMMFTLNPNRQMILYNNFDRYNNKSTFLKKYPSLVNYGLSRLIPDVVDNLCEKIIIISYDNIFNISLFKEYIHNFIFIAHSEQHVNVCNMLNLKYFSLTPLLSNNYMIPFLHNNNCNLITEIERPDFPYLNIFKERRKNEDLDFIITVGQFLKTNKNIELLDDIMSSKTIILLIYTKLVTPELALFANRYQDYVYVLKNIENSVIVSHIQYLDIKYILFAPPNESEFFKSSWSGTISFAFDNDLNLIMPKQIADKYEFKNDVISYVNKDDILSKIQLCKNNFDYKKRLQVRRTSIFNRNNIVWDVLSNNNIFCTIKNFKIEYSPNHEADSRLYESIFGQIPQMHARLLNTTLVDLDLDTSLFSAMCFVYQPEINIVTFTADLDKISMYKKYMVYNNLDKRANIVEGDVDESVIQNKISLIRMSNDQLKNKTIRLIIEKYRPILLIKNNDLNSLQVMENEVMTNYLTILGYNHMMIRNYDVYNV